MTTDEELWPHRAYMDRAGRQRLVQVLRNVGSAHSYHDTGQVWSDDNDTEKNEPIQNEPILELGSSDSRAMNAGKGGLGATAKPEGRCDGNCDHVSSVSIPPRSS